MKKAFIFMITAGILWGTSCIFVHYLTPFGYSSVQLTAMRGLVAALCFAAYALVRDRSLFRVTPAQLLLFFFSGLCLFLTSYCYYSGMGLIETSTAVILMYAAPVYVILFSVLFLGEKLSPLKICGVSGMLLGCVLVSGALGALMSGVSLNGKGIFLSIASGVSYAGYSILTKIAMRKRYNPASTTLYSFLFMGAIAICFANPAEIVTLSAARPAVLVPALLALGVMTFLTPYFLSTLSMRTLPAGTVSALGVMEPMAATLFGVILFRETLTVFSALGIVLVLVCVVLLGMAAGREKG